MVESFRLLASRIIDLTLVNFTAQEAEVLLPLFLHLQSLRFTGQTTFGDDMDVLSGALAGLALRSLDCCLRSGTEPYGTTPKWVASPWASVGTLSHLRIFTGELEADPWAFIERFVGTLKTLDLACEEFSADHPCSPSSFPSSPLLPSAPLSPRRPPSSPCSPLHLSLPSISLSSTTKKSMTPPSPRHYMPSPLTLRHLCYTNVGWATTAIDETRWLRAFCDRRGILLARVGGVEPILLSHLRGKPLLRRHVLIAGRRRRIWRGTSGGGPARRGYRGSENAAGAYEGDPVVAGDLERLSGGAEGLEPGRGRSMAGREGRRGYDRNSLYLYFSVPFDNSYLAFQ